jgi:hypothetical protein
MKGFDVLVVRFLPFVLYAIVCIQIANCWLGIDYYPFNLLHSNSAIYASALFAISLANKRYHCMWNRAMYLFLIIVPIFNYLDGLYIFFEDVDVYLWVISAMAIMTALASSLLATRHFIIVSLRKIENGRK